MVWGLTREALGTAHRGHGWVSGKELRFAVGCRLHAFGVLETIAIVWKYGDSGIVEI